jgi:hypothetical protein
MNREAKKWLARVAFVALVAIGTLIAGPRIAAARDCAYPSAGTCPPLWGSGAPDQQQPADFCPNACAALGWIDGGTCLPNHCCVCFM